MSLQSTRPDVSELTFHLFNRSVHPELFETVAVADVTHDTYRARFSICDAGHVAAVRAHGRTLTEITAFREQPLPANDRCLEAPLRGSRDWQYTFACGVNYHVSYQVERMEPEVFREFQSELVDDAQRAFLAHRFSPVHRLSPAPLSLLQVETFPESLLLHAFHTFPENCAVVKTQSLFEFS